MKRYALTTREGKYVRKKGGGYSTALSTRYYAYAGYDNHGQHTLILELNETNKKMPELEQR